MSVKTEILAKRLLSGRNRAIQTRTRLVKYVCEKCGEEVKAVKGSVCYHCHRNNPKRMVRE